MRYDDDGGGGCIDLDEARRSRTNDMIHSEIRALMRYWQALRGDRQVPYRAEVDPREMDCDPRSLFILEDLGQGNIRFRLAGTGLVDAFGMELSGMSARTLMDGRARESIAALIEETLAEPGVGYARLSTVAPPGEGWELLLLPLRSDFGRIDRVLGGLVPLAGSLRRKAGPPLRFVIDEMSIRTAAEGELGAEAPLPVAGLAEDAAPYEGPAASEQAEGTRLTAIEGGRGDAGEGTEPRPDQRPRLRIVKDE